MIIFDVDGTILPGTSCERLFVPYLKKNRILHFRNFISFCLRAPALLRFGPSHIIKANKGYLRGFVIDDMTKTGAEFFAREVAARISPKAIERINKHLQAGEQVILFSGMPDFLLKNFSEYLGVKEFYGSVMEKSGGKFTGRTLGPFPLGKGKIKALEKILSGWHASRPIWGGKHVPDFDKNTQVTALPEGWHASAPAPPEKKHAVTNGEDPPTINWSDITFYGDHWLDRFLLLKVGHPVVVNPAPKLEALAKERGWQVERWG